MHAWWTCCLNTSAISWKCTSKLNIFFFLLSNGSTMELRFIPGFIYRHFSKISFGEEFYRLISTSNLSELNSELNLHIFTYFEWLPRITSLITIMFTFLFSAEGEYAGILTKLIASKKLPFFIANDDSRISRARDEIKGSSLSRVKSASLRPRFLPPAFNRSSAWPQLMAWKSEMSLQTGKSGLYHGQ